VDVREAARLVDRSPSTVRAWVRAGELDGYREDPRRRNSRLLVSRRELLVLAGLEKAPSPPRPGGRAGGSPPADPDGDGPSRAELLAVELVGSRALAEALRSQVASLEEQVHREAARADDWRDLATRQEAELRALRESAGIPWWRRLLTG